MDDWIKVYFRVSFDLNKGKSQGDNLLDSRVHHGLLPTSVFQPLSEKAMGILILVDIQNYQLYNSH